MLILVLLAGCAQQQVNSSFHLSESDARTAIREMRQSPKHLDRPLVILGGFADIGIGPSLMRFKLEPLLDHEDVLLITFAGFNDFEACRKRVIEAIDERFGKTDTDKTVEVDVVGQSMGGLVAVISAADFGDGSRRLNAKRIFTLSSPLNGAKLAEFAPWTLTTLHSDMRPGSTLYAKLAKAKLDAELFSYTRLHDPVVGPQFAALAGQTPWWVDSPPMQLPHSHGVMDDRIFADVVRRLRGETAYATRPAAPIPQ